MAILVTCKYEEDLIKIVGARVATTQNIDFSNTQGQITPQSEVGSGRNSTSSEMLSSKNKDPDKNKGARVATTLNIDFSHSQGQLPQSMVESCRILNSSENSWLSLLH